MWRGSGDIDWRCDARPDLRTRHFQPPSRHKHPTPPHTCFIRQPTEQPSREGHRGDSGLRASGFWIGSTRGTGRCSHSGLGSQVVLHREVLAAEDALSLEVVAVEQLRRVVRGVGPEGGYNHPPPTTHQTTVILSWLVSSAVGSKTSQVTAIRTSSFGSSTPQTGIERRRRVVVLMAHAIRWPLELKT